MGDGVILKVENESWLPTRCFNFSIGLVNDGLLVQIHQAAVQSYGSTNMRVDELPATLQLIASRRIGITPVYLVPCVVETPCVCEWYLLTTHASLC
ncbi:hypothetical protein LINPERHAP1_LOCUS15235 [Linum perenne]